MKRLIKNILICTIIMSNNIGLSQQIYNITFGSPDWSEIPSEVIEDELGNIYLVGYKSPFNTYPKMSFVLKLSPDGLIINQKDFEQVDSSITLSSIYSLQDSIYLFGTMGPIEIEKENCICGYILDNSLTELYHKCNITNGGNVQIFAQPLTFENDSFILPMIIYAGNNSPSDIGFYKLNRTLDSVLCKIDNRDGIQLPYDFYYSSSQNVYKVFGTGIYPGTFPSYAELITFDSVFDFIGVDTIPWKLVNQFSVRQFKDSTYLLVGKKSNYNPTKMNVGLIQINEDNQMLWNNQFGKQEDTVNYPAVSNSVDYISINNIYLGGTSNIIPLHYPWQPEDSWLMLNQLDSNLILKWQNFYGGDAFYHLWGLKATNDGGCLMYATRYDENTQDQEFDVYILKVDSAGLLTSTGEYPSIPVQQLSIAPNPVQDYVRIGYPDIFGTDEKEILIYNALGIPVRRINATDEYSQKTIDISDLPGGLYFVVLNVNGKKAATGKMLKI